MSHRDPQAAEIVLSDVERAELSRCADDEPRPRVVERARIVLACAEEASNTAVAVDLRLATMTVGKWRSRFAADRVGGPRRRR